MTRRKRKQCVWALVAVLLVSWSAMLAWLRYPLADAASSNEGVAKRRITNQPTDAPIGELASFASVWKRDLSKPVYDPKPPATRAAPKPTLRITLTGTAVDPGYSSAFIKTSSGTTKMVSVGQTVDDAKIISIEQGKITVEFHGETKTLSVAQEGM